VSYRLELGTLHSMYLVCSSYNAGTERMGVVWTPDVAITMQSAEPIVRQLNANTDKPDGLQTN